MLTKTDIADEFMQLQNTICAALEQEDGKARFHEDPWERPGGGGGKTRIIQNGNVIEKGGVNFSQVYGETPVYLKEKLKYDGADFFATGVSIVLHPKSPMVPIIHMNVRYFELDGKVQWFGGGIDLTPHYVDRTDAQYFHQQLKTVCDRHDGSFYERFKTWADDYFYIKHRNEMRGIGGVFFDRLKPDASHSLVQLFDFVKEVGYCFPDIYTHFMAKNKAINYTQEDIDWQMHRRSRYVEFNLVYDMGTKFGLETNGRVASILMSMPPQANWAYDKKVDEGSRAFETQKYLKKGINWLA